MSLGLMAFREESRQMLMMQTLERVVSFCTLLGMVFMHLSAKVWDLQSTKKENKDDPYPATSIDF